MLKQFLADNCDSTYTNKTLLFQHITHFHYILLLYLTKSFLLKVFELRNNNWQQKSCHGKGVDRIKELENQLRNTLDKTFSDKMINMDTCSENSCSGCSATESSHEDAKDEITNKFETYVKTVRIYAKPGVKRDEHLFDCCLLVGLNKRTAYIKMKYPENVSKK